MICNVGVKDRWFRFAVGVIAIVLAFAYSPWWFVLALIGIVTATDGFCLLYAILGISTCKGKQKLKKKVESAAISSSALGLSIAIVSAASILILGLAGMYGYMPEVVRMMHAYYAGFSLSLAGIFLGMVESALDGYVTGFIVGWLYNKLI